MPTPLSKCREAPPNAHIPTPFKCVLLLFTKRRTPKPYSDQSRKKYQPDSQDQHQSSTSHPRSGNQSHQAYPRCVEGGGGVVEGVLPNTLILGTPTPGPIRPNLVAPPGTSMSTLGELTGVGPDPLTDPGVALRISASICRGLGGSSSGPVGEMGEPAGDQPPESPLKAVLRGLLRAVEGEWTA
ncbi:hypothetical protein LTS18_003317 [Coniosporium uncinatum]|uniref:Uncharacterized protein n=1 Tax=Coniosporium uncinatum TaxID=93489 RepID=A0ACC3D796_9PEZI|nr:hypothetical protein LTS18_003317 [Coniosporium uncinatum]